MRRGAAPAVVLLVLGIAASACGDSTPSGSTLPPDAGAILRYAGDAMQALRSVRFELERSGAPVYLDGSGLLAFKSAVGEYASPGSARAVIDVETPVAVFEIGSIAIGEQQWATNPLTQKWDELPPGSAFNPVLLFDSELGWKPLLSEDVTEASLVGLVDLDGEPRYYLRGRARGRRVRVLTVGLAGEQPVDLELWVDPETGRVVRLAFTTVTPDGDATDWLLTLSQFDEPVEPIDPPVTG
ncbi:MAG: LppX_LprAFG lipoprotein [Acidimicrobiia bacterium]